jgi:hypothetical protein
MQEKGPRRHIRPCPVVSFLAAGFVLAGCAGMGGHAAGGAEHADSRAELLSDWEPPGEQICTVAPTPAVLPAPDELVDAYGLAGALDAAFESEIPAGRALFSLRQDSTGVWTRVAAIEGTLPPTTLEQMAGILEPHLTDRPVGNVRLLVETGTGSGLGDGRQDGLQDGFHYGLRLTVGRQEGCGPAVANRDYVSRELERLWREFGVEAQMLVNVDVDTEGRATGGELVRRSVLADLDAEVERLLIRITFHPALNDRIPVATRVQFPLVIRQRM